MAAKVSKLQEQFQKDAPIERQKDGKSSCIFSGVAIYVNGYTGKTSLTTHALFLQECDLLK